MTRLLTAALVCLALAGCDDVLLFDVGPDGRLLAAVDERGRVAAVGDGRAPRHVVRLDPASGEVEQVTASPLALSWPRACGDGVVFVSERRRLVHLDRDGRPRVLFETDLQLFQPTPSPGGARVAVLEASRPGAPGLLHVVDLATGAAGVPLDGAVLGFSWSGDRLVVGRLLAGGAEARHLAGGEGEVLLTGGERTTLLHRGRLPGLTWVAPGARGAVCVLPDALGFLTLARVDLAGAAPAATGERARSLDLWPTIDARERVLFTRSWPDRPTLEGELRYATLDLLGESSHVETPGPVVAPRWVRDDLVAYLTPDDRLVTQALDGTGVVDWTPRLRAAVGGDR